MLALPQVRIDFLFPLFLAPVKMRSAKLFDSVKICFSIIGCQQPDADPAQEQIRKVFDVFVFSGKGKFGPQCMRAGNRFKPFRRRHPQSYRGSEAPVPDRLEDSTSKCDW